MAKKSILSGLFFLLLATLVNASEEIQSNQEMALQVADLTMVGSQSTELPGEPKPKEEIAFDEATPMAYNRAIKWRKDAVLWFLQPDPLTYSWARDSASNWYALFASEEDEKLFSVLVEKNKAPWDREDKKRTRRSNIDDNISRTGPQTTLREAIRLCLANIGIVLVRNISPLYLIDNHDIDFKGRPTWSVSVSGILADNTKVRKFCTVESKTGKILSISDKSSNFY